jgi:hypothetical protein
MFDNAEDQRDHKMQKRQITLADEKAAELRKLVEPVQGKEAPK